MQPGLVMTRLARVKQRRILAKERTNGIRVTSRDRLEPAEAKIAVTAIDLGFERTPAREAVVLRNCEQRVGQLGVRSGPPEVRQTIFGELAEVFERGARRERRVRHRPFLPLSPGVRVSRAGSQGA